MFRSTITRNARMAVQAQSVRTFTTSTRLAKGPIEMGKDALKSVDRAVSNAAVKGIETGEQAADAVKSATGKSEGELKGDAKEMAGEAKGKVNEMTGAAKGKANELKGEAKSKMS